MVMQKEEEVKVRKDEARKGWRVMQKQWS